MKKPGAGLTLEQLKAAGAQPSMAPAPAAPVRDRSAGNAFGVGDDLADVGVGFGKGALSTLMTPAKKLSEIQETIGAGKIANATGAGISQLQEQSNQMAERYIKMAPDDPQKEQLRMDIRRTQEEIAKLGSKLPVAEASVGAETNKKFSFLKPTTTAQKVGYGAEKIAEFLVPAKAVLGTQKAVLEGGEALTKAKAAGELNLAGRTLQPIARPLTALGNARKAGELNLLGKAVETTARTGVRAATEAAGAGLVTAAQGGDLNEVKTSALVGAAFPIAGALLRGVVSPFKSALGATGKKIQETVIRPTAADMRDGFNINNVNKYGLGGSLEQTVTKSHTELNKLGQQLKKTLEQAGDDGARVDLREVVQNTANRLNAGKTKTFGNNRSIEKVFGNMVEDLRTTTDGKAVVDLLDATNIKRGAGTKGAWVFGNADPDASAIEKVYTTLYQELRKAIEKNAPKSVREINKRISEIIPISNAALRRLPVAQRNNVISLTDSIGLYAAMFDPSALALIGANKLSKSGKFGAFLVKLAEKEKQSRTPVGKLLFGK